MKSIRYLAPNAIVGSGFEETAFRAALTPDLAFIGCDGGSCDGGPGYLGGKRFFRTRNAVKRDLRLMVLGAARAEHSPADRVLRRQRRNWNLNWVWEIVQEIAREENLHFKTAIVESEPDRDVLVQKLRDGRIKPLDPRAGY